MRPIKNRATRSIPGTDTITNKSDRNNSARHAWHEENNRHQGITRKTKAPDTS